MGPTSYIIVLVAISLFVPGWFDCGNHNPCTANNRDKKKYFFTHPDKRMYVRCDNFGRCWERDCAPGTTFNAEHSVCAW